jgi:metal-sulfur cluster biosynthetic enzyme
MARSCSNWKTVNGGIQLSQLKEEIIEKLKQVFDPEISINIYDLGLIYDIAITDTNAIITMTLTSAFCPAADYIVADVRSAVLSTSVTDVEVNIVFEPLWGPDVISDEGKLALGIF